MDQFPTSGMIPRPAFEWVTHHRDCTLLLRRKHSHDGKQAHDMSEEGHPQTYLRLLGWLKSLIFGFQSIGPLGRYFL